MNGASPGEYRLASLVARIRKLYYVEAGQPSYPMLSREADRIIAEADDEESDWLRPLPRATACDLISGKSKRTPDWLLVRMLVVVCHRIATKSNLDIASQGTFVKEFGQLWRAAKEDEEGCLSAPQTYAAMHDRREELAGDQIAGDVLEPAPGESPSRRTTPRDERIPGSWGRLGSRRLRQAEDGDAQAAYEVAVLLACEAIELERNGTPPEEVTFWRRREPLLEGAGHGQNP